MLTGTQAVNAKIYSCFSVRILEIILCTFYAFFCDVPFFSDVPKLLSALNTAEEILNSICKQNNKVDYEMFVVHFFLI